MLSLARDAYVLYVISRYPPRAVDLDFNNVKAMVQRLQSWNYADRKNLCFILETINFI